MIDPALAFLRKFRIDIVLSACAVLQSVDREGVVNARKNILGPPITIDDYIFVLRAWKYYRAIEFAKSYDEFKKLIKNIRKIPFEISNILDKIAEKWFNEEVVLYALPKTIEALKLNTISYKIYLQEFIERKNSII